MLSPRSFASLATLGLLMVHNASASATTSSAQPRVNGWYPCSFSTFHNMPANRTSLQDMAVFECAELQVPLCYDGVCDHKTDRTIELFVKRRLGKMENEDPTAPRKAAILIQGGPGGSSVVMEDVMSNLIQLDHDNVDYYTFDHRGTGRSEFLQCDAASALTPGGPGGAGPSTDELPTCLEDLNVQYDGQAAAFSVTSAAMDVRSLIDTFLPKHDVFVSGLSYGTFLAQRILQLDVPQVKGYIFDGVDVLTTKHDPIESANSHWNQAMTGPAQRLLEFCFDDPKCPLKLKARETALEDVLTFLDSLDDSTHNACATAVAKALEKDSASDAMRMLMYANVASMATRAKGLALLGAVQRCSVDDLAFINTEVSESTSEGETPAPTTPAPLDSLGGISPLLYNVIVYSERFAQPAPTRDERDTFFYGTPVGNDIEELALGYCLFTGSTEPACEELKDELPASNATFFYKRDQYYEVPITLPDHASALVINGGLDFATPRAFGELLYKKLQGSGKGTMMVNFDYGTHCGGEGVAEAPTTPCRDAIVRQFIMSGGDVTAVDTSCMEALPVAVFHLEEAKPTASKK